MGLSFDNYQKMMKSGQIGWNMDIINGTAKQINDMSDLIRGQQTAAEPRLSPGNFQEVQRQYGQINNNVAYMRAYSDFLKQNSPEDFDALSAHLSKIDRVMTPMSAWIKQGYQPQEYNAAAEMRQAQAARSALHDMRQKGMSAEEAGAQYGIDSQTLNESYKAIRAQEKRDDLAAKYDTMTAKELVAAIKSPDALGEMVYEKLREKYDDKSLLALASDKANDWIFDKTNTFGLSTDQIKEIIQRRATYNDHHYDSARLSDEERGYILDKLLEKSSVNELEQLRKELPEGSLFDDFRKGIDGKMQEKKMDEYYLNVLEKYPDAGELIARFHGKTAKSTAPSATATALGMPDTSGLMPQAEKTSDEKRYEQMIADGVDVEQFKKWRERYQAQSVNKLQNLLIKAFTQSSPAAAAAASVASVPVNMIGSLVHDVPQYIGANIDRLTGGDGYIDPEGTINSKVQAVRDATMEMMGDDHPLAQFLYSTGMSMGESGFAMLANLIPVVGPALSNAMFFSNAGVSAANDVIKNGGSLGQATATMVAFGAAELLTERFSLEKLKALQANRNVRSAKKLFLNILKQGTTEGSEEVAATLADSFADGLINRDNSEFNRNIKAYMEQGLSREEAESRAWGDWWKGLAMDAAGGALSGAIFGGATSAVNFKTGKQAAKVGNLDVTQAELADLAGEDNKEAVKTAEGIVKKQGVSKVLEAAKLSENEEVKQTAAHFEEVAKKSKLDEGDVAQLLVKASQAQIESNRFDAFARETGAETRSDYIEKSGKSAELLHNYDLSGAKLAEDRTAATSSFGAAHPNGVAAVDQNGKQVVVTGIDSSVPEYGRNDNTVSVVLNDGRTVDARGVNFDNSDIQRLVNMAARFDSVGARALLANYEEAAQSGVGVDAYEQSFARLYEIAQKGSSFESLRKNAAYGADIAALGENVARAAVEAGLADGDISSQTRSFFQKRVRVKGRKFSESKVHLDLDVKLDKDSDVFSVLQGVAEVIGKKVVVTHALNDDDKGVYVNNTIYINANQAEHAMVTAALHEAVHNMRAYSEEDFRTLQKFVMNYLVAGGQDVERMLDSIAALYGKDAPSLEVQVEELVCKTVESLAANREALETALDVKQNKSIREKVGEILQRIADKVLSYFKGDKANGLLAHNRYAQVFLDDAKALQEMAQIVRQGFENAKANEREFGSKESGARYDIGISEPDPNVKKRISDITKTKQFKEWFGDWEKNLHDASKVVDNDGKPLVVYHQTGADFTVFNTESKGAGKFDDETPNGIFLKPSSADIGLKGKKQMALYANIREPLRVNNRNDLVRFYSKNIPEYIASKQKIKDIDTTYKVKFEEELKRENQEYQKYWEAWRRGEITKEEYTEQTKRDKLEALMQEWEEKTNEARESVKTLISNFFKKSKYDGVIIEQDAGSFGRSTKTYIAFEGEQVKSATDNIGTFDKHNPDIRYSKDDTIYLSAVERGDMETAQRMVDEAAERAFNNSKIRDEDGKLLMVYHGSEADFTVFDKTKGRANMDIQGMFFSPWKLDASGYGSKVRRFYLNITNPANESTGYRALSKHKSENNAGIKAREDLEQMGFDGVNNEDEEFIAFDSEQIKSADPVTYDDNGNVIPLSARFNKNNPDIRYSKDDTIYDEPYNQYSLKQIERFIAIGEKYKDLTVDEFVDKAYDYGISALPFLSLGYDNPGFKPVVKTYYRIGEPRLASDGTYKNSYNFADDKPEEGISVVTTDWLHSFKSVFFGVSDADLKRRGVYKMTGFELPSKGGDDEKLIIPLDWAVKTKITTKRGLQTAVRESEKANEETVAKKSSARYSKDDTIYLSAVERGDMATAQRMVDEAARAAGYDMHLYHGSKSGGGFTVFKGWQYFTETKPYAERYTQRDTGKGLYNVFVKSSRLFDTRKPADRALFKQYRNEYGMGELQESGLPDWTDGYDLSDIIEENDLDYDGIVLDEGGDLVNGKPVSRGESYVIRSSEQIKSADPVTYDDNGNVIPLSARFNKNNPDIRYSKDDTIYSGMYEDGDLYFGDPEEDDDLPFDFGEDDGEEFYYSEEDNKEKEIDVQRLMDDYEPREAVYRLYSATASMTEKVIKGYRVKLPRASYEKVARSVMRKFGIREKYNSEMVGELADTIENYIRQIARDKKSAFSTHLNGLATACRRYLEESVDYTRGINEEIGKDIANYLHGATILITPFAESHVMDNHNDSLKSLRRALGGYVNVGFERDAYKYKRPVYMDDVIDELASITGGGMDENYETHSPLFPDGERPDSLSGWSWLENVIDTYVRPQYIHHYGKEVDDYYYESVNAAAAEMALEINTAIAGERANAARNKRSEDKKSLQSIDKRYQKLLSMQKVLSRSKEIQQEKEIEKLKARVMKERGLKEMAREDLDVLKSYVKSDMKNFREQYLSQERAHRDIEAVRRQMAKVRTMIMNPTNEKFIPPEILHNKVFLDTFEALGEAVVLNNRTQAAAKMALLMQQLRAMKTESKKFDGDFETAFDKDFITELQNISDWLKYDTEIKKLHRANFSSDELHDLRLAVDEIIYRIENARKLLLRKDGMLAREASDNVIRETRAIDAKQANKLYSLFSQKLMNPLRVINHMSGFNENSELRKLFYALNEGQRKQWLWEMNAEKLFAAMVEKNEDDYKRACNDVVKYDYTAEGKGYHVEMTRMQALQVMMTWKREAKSRMNHMKRGGIVVADPKKVAKGKGKVWKNAQCVPVSDDLIDQMLKSMGKFEMDYMRTAEHYFNDIAKKAINETFMVTRHREIARSDYYIPVKVDDKFSNREIESLKFDFTIEGAGSYKHITPGAPQPILISSLNSVIDRHIHQTGKLYGLDIPLINFRRMFKGTTNYATESGANWYTADSVKKALSDKFGEESVKYIEDTISKLEGGRKEDKKTFHEVAEFLYRTKVRTSLVGNLGVVIKQAASYPTAGLYLSAKDMYIGLGKFIGRSFTKRYKSIIAEIDAHTAQHYIRRKGMSVQEVADMMRGTKLERKLPTVLNPVKWIQGMDCITTAALWEATKENVNTAYKKAGKKTGTDTYWNDVTNLYDTIIEDTQPMYDELHRSEFQKSGGSLKKAVFPFKTQPLQNMGILADAGAQLAVKRDKQSAVRFAKAVQSQVWSNVVFSAMTFFAAIIRHRFDRYRDEEDRVTPASVTPQVLLDMMDNALNTVAPVGGSYVKTLAEDALDSIKEKKLKFNNTGNELELNLLNDWLDKFAKAENILQKQLDGTNKANVDPWKLTWKVLDVPGTFSELFGLPYNNLSLLFKGAYNNFSEKFGIAPVNNYGELKVDHIAQHIINAYDSGNSSKGAELTRMWVQQKMSEGQAEAKATENVNKKLAAGLAQTETARQAMTAGAGGNYGKAEKLKAELVGKGFSQDLVDAATAQALRDVYAMLKDEKPKDREEAESILLDYGFDDTGAAEVAAKWESQETTVYNDYRYSDAFNALKNGDKEGFEVVKSAIVTERHNDKQEYSEKDFMSQLLKDDRTKPLFEELEAATDGNDRKRLERVRVQLLNVFGSESEWRAAYQKYLTKKNN